MPDRPTTLEQLNSWAPWGVARSMRDGKPALSETALWYLQLKHPEVVERDGGETYLYLDRAYRVVRQGDRAWVALEPAPQRRPPLKASPAASSS